MLRAIRDPLAVGEVDVVEFAEIQRKLGEKQKCHHLVREACKQETDIQNPSGRNSSRILPKAEQEHVVWGFRMA